MTNISVICPTYRNPKCLDIFLRSATENKVLPETEIIVVLDGFAEESAHLIDKYPNVTWIKFEQNQGMQRAINLGVYSANNEGIFVLNDDNVFGKDYDRILSEIYDPNTVITANQIERAPSIFHFPVGDFGDPDMFDYEKFQEMEPAVRDEKFTPDGNIFPFLINKRWFMVVGGFDTFYDSPNVCDLDFFLKLELCGFECVRAHHLHLYHFGSVATKKNAEKDIFTEKERRAFDSFKLKWGIPATYGVNNSKLPPIDFVRGIRYR
jgi:GT2 family glycosyltransferase